MKLRGVLLGLSLIPMLPVAAFAACRAPEGFTPIYSAAEFDGIRNNLAGRYFLCRSLSFREPFEPIGGVFIGELDGNGRTIRRLTISRSASSTAPTGLFERIDSAGIVRNLRFTSVAIEGNEYVGTVAGMNRGLVDGVEVISGSVKGTNLVGGIVGYNTYGDLTNSLGRNLEIRGHRAVGGLVGTNGDSRIANCASRSKVFGDELAGGLVGYNSVGIIENSRVVTKGVSAKFSVGGLVGSGLDSVISGAYVSGQITGETYVGGLIGDEFRRSGWIARNQVIAKVTGLTSVGGLIGFIDGWGTNHVRDSFALGSVKGTNRVGGLIGQGLVEVNTSYARNSIISSCSAPTICEVGGLVGKGLTKYQYTSSAVDSFYSTTGNSTLQPNGFGTPKTNAELTLIETFTNWDISDASLPDATLWKIAPGAAPYLNPNM